MKQRCKFILNDNQNSSVEKKDFFGVGGEDLLALDANDSIYAGNSQYQINEDNDLEDTTFKIPQNLNQGMMAHSNTAIA